MRHAPATDHALAAAAIGGIAFVAIGGALVLEHAFGYLPCMLCLWQRWPYYVGVPLAALVAVAAWRGASPALVRTGLGALALCFLVAAGLGIYHAGVEWAFWPGPTSCAGANNAPTSAADLMARMRATRVVPCDEAAFRFAGLSLAGWNALVGLTLVAIAGWGMARPGGWRSRSL